MGGSDMSDGAMIAISVRGTVLLILPDSLAHICSDVELHHCNRSKWLLNAILNDRCRSTCIAELRELTWVELMSCQIP